MHALDAEGIIDCSLARAEFRNKLENDVGS